MMFYEWVLLDFGVEVSLQREIFNKALHFYPRLKNGTKGILAKNNLTIATVFEKNVIKATEDRGLRYEPKGLLINL